MLLQPKLSVKVSQRQVLTPGLVQMVSVLALNKLELKEMINTEMVENPVLEELDPSDAPLDELAGLEGDRERSAEQVAAESERLDQDPKDPFEEVDFGSYFQEYLDPGFRTGSSMEEYDRPSFEHFLSAPSSLSDHLLWQLGAMTLAPEVRAAAELVIGNLDECGYLTATDDELTQALAQLRTPPRSEPIPFERGMRARLLAEAATESAATEPTPAEFADGVAVLSAAAARADQEQEQLHTAVVAGRETVNHLDP
ncbi:MAG: RNA polymerase sigma-54 factor, partial [Rhodospirillales bacterium]|nr:RNA polymerase sigma-54 factor [Acetobacter sp.]